MKYLIDSFNSILRMGTDNPRINLALVQRIKVANVIALIGACNNIIILPLIFFLYHYDLMPLNIFQNIRIILIVGTIGYAATPIVNKFHYHLLARLIFIVNVHIIVFLGTIVLHIDQGGWYYLFPVVVFPFMLFLASELIVIIVSVFLSVLCVLSLKMIDFYSKDGLDFSILEAFFAMASLITLILPILYFFIINNRAEEAIKGALNEAETLRKKAENQTKQLKDLDNQKTTFFQNMSHELRTPLTLILTPLENLMEKDPGDTDVAIATKNARRLLRLVNQLLDFQKLAAGKRELQLLPTNLAQLTYVCGEYFATACSHRDIDFTMICNDEPLTDEADPLWIKGEVDAIEKIIFNYLSNALKYTPDRGRIMVSLVTQSDRVRLGVKDSGSGIGRHQQSKLFNVFSQVDNSTTREYEGSGLGLALVKSLAEEMFGTVGVESELNEGSLFWADFPMLSAQQLAGLSKEEMLPEATIVDKSFIVKSWLLADDQEKRGQDDQHVDAVEAIGGKAQILIVDDLPDMRDLISGCLRKYQYGVMTAANGRAGMESLKKHTPDLIVTDWMMPEMSGPEMIKQLKTDPILSSIPVILLTAKSDEESKLIGIEVGADGFLGKPFSEQELTSLIRNLLQLKSRETELKLAHDELKISSDEKIRHTKNLLTQAEKLSQLGALLASIGHEIANPISLISLSCSNEGDLLKKLEKDLLACFDIDDEETRKMGQHVQQQIDDLRKVNEGIKVGSQRLKDLSMALRTQSRLERQATKDVNINEVIKESVIITGGRIKSFEIDKSLGDLKEITCFRSKIGQVVTNLLANAADALEEKRQNLKDQNGSLFKGKIRLSTEVRHNDNTLGVLVTIADNGDGVPDTLREKIFEQFYTTREAGKGTGLGLSLCLEIVKEHGGDLNVSEDNDLGGAKFELWLPADCSQRNEVLDSA